MGNGQSFADQSRSTPGATVGDDGFCYFWGHPARKIKIGATADLGLRLRTLRWQYSLPHMGYLATVKGGGALERAYHARFAEHRLHGEWFAPHPDILAEIERLNA